MWIIINKRHFLIFSHNCTYKSLKPRRTYNSEASAKWKEVISNPYKINGLILKIKADLKEGPDNIRVILRLCFLFIDWSSFGKGRGGHLKLAVQGQGGEKILDVDGQGGWGSWKLDNFYGYHMRIISSMKSFAQKMGKNFSEEN